MIRKLDGAPRPANPLARPRYALFAGLLLAAPAAAAAKRGCLYAVPKWSTAVPPGKAATRDVGDFVRAMYEHFVRTSPNLAWEAQFGNDSLDGTGAHSFWNPVSCPNASAAYAECWRPRWAPAAL